MYILIVQNTTDKKITTYKVCDSGDSRMYFHFDNVDLTDLKEGEHRYFLICDNGFEVKITQNDAKDIHYDEDKYVIVSQGNLITAEDIYLVVKGEPYPIRIPVIAEGLIMVGEFKGDGKSYDKPQEYVQYV